MGDGRQENRVREAGGYDPKGQGGCLSESDVGPTAGHDVNSATP